MRHRCAAAVGEDELAVAADVPHIPCPLVHTPLDPGAVGIGALPADATLIRHDGVAPVVPRLGHIDPPGGAGQIATGVGVQRNRLADNGARVWAARDGWAGRVRADRERAELALVARAAGVTRRHQIAHAAAPIAALRWLAGAVTRLAGLAHQAPRAYPAASGLRDRLLLDAILRAQLCDGGQATAEIPIADPAPGVVIAELNLPVDVVADLLATSQAIYAAAVAGVAATIHAHAGALQQLHAVAGGAAGRAGAVHTLRPTRAAAGVGFAVHAVLVHPMHIAAVAARAAGRWRRRHPCGGDVGWRLLGGDVARYDEVGEEGDEGEGCQFLHLAEDGRRRG